MEDNPESNDTLLHDQPPFNVWNHLDNIVRAQNNQDQTYWTIFGVFWPTNALLLVALFSDGKFPEAKVGFIISIIGFLLSILWGIIQFRTTAHLDYLDELVRRIEFEYKVPKNLAFTKTINEELNKWTTKRTIRIRPIIKYIPFVTALLWAFAAYSSLIMIIGSLFWRK